MNRNGHNSPKTTQNVSSYVSIYYMLQVSLRACCEVLWAKSCLEGQKSPQKGKMQLYDTARFVHYGKIHVKYGTAYYIIRIRRMTHPWPEPYIHGVFTVFWAGKPPNVRSYTVYSVYIRFWPTLTIACATFIH